METPILFKFVKMDLTQFATFESLDSSEKARLEILNRFQFAYNFSEHLVNCKTIIEVNKSEDILLKAELDSFFQIDPECSSVIESDEEAVIPQGLLAQFASLAYGSLRGVIYFKSKGTLFENFILPPNDLTSVFVKPQIFKRNTFAR